MELSFIQFDWRDDDGIPRLWFQWSAFFLVVFALGTLLGVMSERITVSLAIFDLFIFHAPFLMLIHYIDYLTKRPLHHKNKPKEEE